MLSWIILICHIPLAVTISLTLYQNAYFSPFDSRYLLSNLSFINSTDSCLCQCSAYILCSTVVYSSTTQLCTLFFANLNQGQLQLVATNTSTCVYSFNNRSLTNLTVMTPMNETVYAIWNTTVGGDSLSAYSGYYSGSYWPSDPAKNVFDGNLTTDFTSHGVCNYALVSLICGQNTGFYFTPRSGSMIVIGFRLGTNNYDSSRDPLTVTVEGSNSNESAFTLGSSWTLIYNGSSGLLSSTNHGQWGTIQVLSGPFVRFSSFRFLVTTKRGVQCGAAYSEYQLIYY
ncbi:unnamed protein product [Adineta ricciae]|uniref:Uncharacterized protein n=2 Tax=Adineta ricciae TaxID=249248 RepID=A0A815HRP7_ADIRI|nr:unnamed protein product [Adineta ricciae]